MRIQTDEDETSGCLRGLQADSLNHNKPDGQTDSSHVGKTLKVLRETFVNSVSGKTTS